MGEAKAKTKAKTFTVKAKDTTKIFTVKAKDKTFTVKAKDETFTFKAKARHSMSRQTILPPTLWASGPVIMTTIGRGQGQDLHCQASPRPRRRP